MICKWESYLSLLPGWLRNKVRETGAERLLELRLRYGLPVEAITTNGSAWFTEKVCEQDLNYVINMASKYSPWTTSGIGDCYITAEGGHRIGICGQVAVKDDQLTGVTFPTSISVRVSKDFSGIAATACSLKGSILIIGPPGSGKTTFLRDLVRQKSDREEGCIGVVDEKSEIFPKAGRSFVFYPGKRTDVLSGSPKAPGILCVLKNMTPRVIATDEITAKEDCKALLHAAWCGVELIATAHAGSRSDLMTRPVYRDLLSAEIFDQLIIMDRNFGWYKEGLCL